MDTQDASIGRDEGSAGSEAAGRASLQLELQVPERQMLAPFREAFLRWLTDRSGPFARALGPSDRLAFDELPPADDPQGRSTLRLAVSWSVAEETGTDDQAALPAFSDETDADAVPVDRFVFFPDPAQTGAPLFRQISAPLGVEAFPSSQQRRMLRAELPESLKMAKEFVVSLQSFVRRSAASLGLSGLTVRYPALAAHRRAWSLGLLGSVAVATGFVAGSVYLSTTERPPRAAATAPVAAAAAAAPAASAPGQAAPLERTAAVSPPPVQPASEVPSMPPPQPPTEAAAPVSRPAQPEPALAAGRTSAIPDTEVTTDASPRKPVARPATLRRPEVLVVRAVDGAAASTGAPSRSGKGALLVKSDPAGAEVSINGVVQGRTPLMIRDLGAGSRVLRLELPGFARWSWAVTVAANKSTPVTVKLQPEANGAR